MSATIETRRLLTARQVAERLGCSWRTVYRLADVGELPEGVKVGRLRRWDATEIESWISQGCPRARRLSR